MSDANDTSTRPPHWPALDGLRGVAVAGVVAYHLGVLPGGFLGVDLFFVLSGFLITSLLVDEVARTGRVALRAFWGRRARRLLPAVTVMVALVLTVVGRWGTAAERAGARDDAPWALGYLANWHQIAESHDYWAASAASSVFKHLWSLAIEEQFYVLWPLVAWGLLRCGRRIPVAATALAAAVSAVVSAALADDARPNRAYLGTDTRAVSLLLGALIALPAVRDATTALAQRARDRHPAATRHGVDLLALLLLASWVFAGEQLGLLTRGGLALHGTGAAVLIVVVTARTSTSGPGRVAPQTRFERICSSSPLVWLGQRSYGIYLWHWPLIVLASTRWTQLDGWAKDVGIVSTTLLLSVASFELLEQPIRRRGGWASGRSTARLATATCVVAALVATALASDGRGDVAPFTLAAGDPVSGASTPGAEGAGDAPTSAEAGRAKAADANAVGPTTTLDDTVATTQTDAGTAGSAGATTNAPPGTPTATSTAGTEPEVASEAVAPGSARLRRPAPTVSSVLWIGDSVAADEAPAVLAALSAAGIPGVDGAWAGRRFVESDGVVPADIFPPLVAPLQADDLVIVQLSLWDSPFSLDTQRAAFQWFVDLVAPTGAQLLFITPPPIREDLIDPGMDRQIEVVHDLEAAAPDHVRFLDTAPLWGPVVDADIDDDGAPDRKPDLVHVCPQGAARFATWLVGQLVREYRGIAPTDPATWLGGTWQGDERYDTPVGACAALPVPAG